MEFELFICIHVYVYVCTSWLNHRRKKGKTVRNGEGEKAKTMTQNWYIEKSLSELNYFADDPFHRKSQAEVQRKTEFNAKWKYSKCPNNRPYYDWTCKVQGEMSKYGQLYLTELQRKLIIAKNSEFHRVATCLSNQVSSCTSKLHSKSLSRPSNWLRISILIDTRNSRYKKGRSQFSLWCVICRYSDLCILQHQFFRSAILNCRHRGIFMAQHWTLYYHHS